MGKPPLIIAWISDFPVEWLADVPAPLQELPRQHPATWQLVLLSEFERNPDLRVHVLLFRRRIRRSLSFERNGVFFHVLKASALARLASLFWADTLLIRRACRRIQPALLHAWGSEKGAGLIASRLKYPYLMTIQGLFAWYKETVPLSNYERFVERLERASLPRAPLVTTESRFAVEFLAERYPGLSVHQAEHAPNRAFFEVQRRPETNPVHFVCVGGLGFRKGTDLLFQASERLLSEMSFRLTLICDPNPAYRQSLQASTPSQLSRRVQFKENLLPEQVAKELETPTLMLLPTRADVSPNAVKEAVVAGLPVVASNTGGVPDYVRDGQNGLLFPPGDLDGFVKAIREAVQNPLFSQGKVTAEALAQSREYLSPERMAQNFLAAYQRAVGLARDSQTAEPVRE